MSPNLTPTVEKYQQNQKAAHDGKKQLVNFLEGEKVLVLNNRGKTKWVSGIIVKQKSPVTYLVKVGPKVRFCHVDHLLHTAVENINSEPDIMDELPEIRPPQAGLPTEEVVAGSEMGTQEVDVAVPLRRSAREVRAPRRLIEEL